MIGPKKLLELVKTVKLVENLSKRELENPEGAGFDIRFGEVYRINGKGFLGIEERETPKSKLVDAYKEGAKKKLTVNPGNYFLVKSIEKVNMPDDLVGHVFPRSTLFRSGLLLLVTQISPGYKGGLTFGLANIGPSTISLELGSRIAQVQFAKVEGGGTKYRGQWMGGRVSTEKKEKQV